MWSFLRPYRTTIFVVSLVIALVTWAFVHEARQILAQKLTSWTDDTTADCAVVLTGGSNRIREGIDLLSRGSIQKLIISGVHPHAGLREIFPLWPYYGELKENEVILERRSRTTYGNAQQTLPLVEALHCRDLIVVTSRAHMRRALMTFRAEFPPGFALIPRAVAPGSYEPRWTELATETMKSLFYSIWAY